MLAPIVEKTSNDLTLKSNPRIIHIQPYTQHTVADQKIPAGRGSNPCAPTTLIASNCIHVGSTRVRASFLAVSPALTPCAPTTLIASNCIHVGITRVRASTTSIEILNIVGNNLINFYQHVDDHRATH